MQETFLIVSFGSKKVNKDPGRVRVRIRVTGCVNSTGTYLFCFSMFKDEIESFIFCGALLKLYKV